MLKTFYILWTSSMWCQLYHTQDLTQNFGPHSFADEDYYRVILYRSTAGVTDKSSLFFRVEYQIIRRKWQENAMVHAVEYIALLGIINGLFKYRTQLTTSMWYHVEYLIARLKFRFHFVSVHRIVTEYTIISELKW